jgi:SWI/SNF-related matrix-associated actin-dependent regulator 1 of chromatin subfamily A
MRTDRVFLSDLVLLFRTPPKLHAHRIHRSSLTLSHSSCAHSKSNFALEMSSFFNGNAEAALVPDSPAAKRQKTASGYHSTSNSADNTGAYNSDIDSGDELFRDYIPDTPAHATFHTQPTQIVNKSGPAPSSPPGTPGSIIEVAASSPLRSRVADAPKPPAQRQSSTLVQNGPVRPVQKLALSMAPAGTVYKPPPNIPPTKTYITIDDDDDGPQFQGGSSDEDDDSANIKPSTFAPRSAGGSFGTSPVTRPMSGHAKFQNILANAAYKPSSSNFFSGRTSDSMSMGYGSAKKPLNQMRPERARPIEDISCDSLSDQKMRDSVKRVRDVFPHVTVLAAKNALVTCKGNLDDTMDLLSTGGPTVISDDEIVSPQPAKKQEPQMKRVLEAPVISIKDRYGATQAPPTQKLAAATPPKPKKRLVKGRRHPSSPVAPPSPIKEHASPAISVVEDYDSDSGVASATDEDNELDDRVLKYLNSCNVDDLVELTSTSKANAELMIASRPFKSLDAARNVTNPASLKSGRKSAKVPLGEKIVDTAIDMFSGYEAIDTLVTKCEELGKPLAEEMGRWGFDVFGAAKDGELEMTSFEDDSSSQRDSGIGSPNSGVVSINGDGGDDDIKIVATVRKRSPANYLKKPEMMAENCVLKDYQVVGLNWLALMYRHKLSCILADEMGLGKTCQVISLLTHLVETGNGGPHLVICPGSTLENWLREFPKFSPRLTVEPYYGIISTALTSLAC